MLFDDGHSYSINALQCKAQEKSVQIEFAIKISNM